MSKQTHVPKFGNWDANDHVPFTLVFEKARADKGTGTGNKIINPNDPSENPSAFGIKTDNAPPFRRPPQHQYPDDKGTGTGNKIINPNDPSENPAAFGIKTDNAPPFRRPAQHEYPDDFGLRADPGHGRPYANGSPLRPTMASHAKRGSHGGASDSEGAGFGEDQSAEQSPSHPSPAFKGRLGNRPVSSSLSPDRKGSPEGGTPPHHLAQPARTRFRPGSRGEETPDRTALPKFGAWDEKDPTSGEGFTAIFSQARNEKKVGGPARIPALQSEPPTKMDHDHEYKQPHYPIRRKASSWSWGRCFHARDAM